MVKYKVLLPFGKSVIVTATSADEARDKVMHKGYIVMSVTKA